MVRLSDGTVGEVISVNAPVVGHEMTISSHDDSGNPITVTGVVEDVLEAETSKQ